VSEIYYEGQQPLVGSRTPLARVYVPTATEIKSYQPVRRERTRITRRHIQLADGREGLEITEERDVTYAPPLAHGQRKADPVRGGLAGIVAFLTICIVFTGLGGGDQSLALIPIYWGAFGALWWGLS
jgi:hypothetical protein